MGQEVSELDVVAWLAPPPMVVVIAKLCLTLHDPMDYESCQALCPMGFSERQNTGVVPFPSPGSLAGIRKLGLSHEQFFNY